MSFNIFLLEVDRFSSSKYNCSCCQDHFFVEKYTPKNNTPETLSADATPYKKKKKKGQLLVLALNACPTSQSLCERHLEIFSLAQAVKGDAPEGSSLLNRNNDKIKACSYMFFQQQSAAPG